MLLYANWLSDKTFNLDSLSVRVRTPSAVQKNARDCANVGELGLSVKQVLRLSEFDSHQSHKIWSRRLMGDRSTFTA